MVKGSRESERLLELGQHPVDRQCIADGLAAVIANLVVGEIEVGQDPVDHQGLGDRCCALVADLVEIEAATTGKRAQCQMSAKKRSGDGQRLGKRALT